MIALSSAVLALAAVANALPQQVATELTSTTATTGTPIGAKQTDILAPSIPSLPPGPDASSYPRNGQLNAPQPAPYTPSGGLGTNGSEPNYQVKSDFDFESIALGLYQEYFELDLFSFVLQRFSPEEFEAEGLTSEDRDLIAFMATQEVGHAALLTNMLGEAAPVACNYTYPFDTVREFIDFTQKQTRAGEAGVYGFLPHLNSRESAQLLLQSITTEARQQMIMRQFEGLFAMPEFFQVGIPQSWHWTLLAPFISSCPEGQTRLIWQNFPALTVVNNPNPVRTDPLLTGLNEGVSSITPEESCREEDCPPRQTNTRPALSFPGRKVLLSWEDPGKPIGPDQSYVTATTAGHPQYVAWVSQLNVTYSLLENIQGNTGETIQPDVATLGGDPAINGTMFVALTDAPIVVTPFNISLINPHVRAGPAVYQAG